MRDPSRRETEVDLLSSDEFRKAVESTVKSTGRTVDELRLQGKSGRFDTHRERVAWDLIRASDRLKR